VCAEKLHFYKVRGFK